MPDGVIPHRVERFLEAWVGLWMWRGPQPGEWTLSVPGRNRGRRHVFDWPHDREPTLQEAIEAVMGHEPPESREPWIGVPEPGEEPA